MAEVMRRRHVFRSLPSRYLGPSAACFHAIVGGSEACATLSTPPPPLLLSSPSRLPPATVRLMDRPAAFGPPALHLRHGWAAEPQNAAAGRRACFLLCRSPVWPPHASFRAYLAKSGACHHRSVHSSATRRTDVGAHFLQACLLLSRANGKSLQVLNISIDGRLSFFHCDIHYGSLMKLCGPRLHINLQS